MAITVHDGTEGSEYQSYASLIEADAYHEVRATPEWVAVELDATKEAALVRATDYIDATYGFVCDVAPRHPLKVKATIVLAVHMLSGSVSAPAQREIVEIEQELDGVGSTRTKYEDREVRDLYPMVTKILAPITGQIAGSIGFGRVIR